MCIKVDKNLSGRNTIITTCSKKEMIITKCLVDVRKYNYSDVSGFQLRNMEGVECPVQN